MSIKILVKNYMSPASDSDEDRKGKHIVSARIRLPTHTKLEHLSKQFGVKKGSLAAELLEAAIDEAWEEANRDRS